MNGLKKSFYVFSAVVIVLAVVLGSPGMASTNALSTLERYGLPQPACSSDQHQAPELVRLHDEISKAGSLTEAQNIALEPTSDALDAVTDAITIAPFSDDLRLAETRLIEVRSRIKTAKTQQEVADEFSGMMMAGLDDDRAAHVRMGKVGCDYSTGETIAIILGLIFGIIPGLILLVLLC